MRPLLLLALAVSALAADPPVAPGAKPTLVDSAGVGEGPAWGPQGRLCYSGGNRIQRRNAADQRLATLRKL